MFLIAGISFIARSAMDLGSPVYYDPVTVLDYAAVIGTTVAMLALSISLGFGFSKRLTRLGRGLVWIPATGAAVSGLANFAEDGLGVSAAGVLFAVGNLAILAGLLLAGIVVLLRIHREYGAWLLALFGVFFLPLAVTKTATGVVCLVIAFRLRSLSADQASGV